MGARGIFTPSVKSYAVSLITGAGRRVDPERKVHGVPPCWS